VVNLPRLILLSGFGLANQRLIGITYSSLFH
jgi:hypothetical protein